MRINTNIDAFNAQRNLGVVNTQFGKSVEKLSSGFRINRAGDDAAGLSISEKLRAQVRGLSQASRNAQDGISLIQTAEGGLNESHSILQRMRELAVQASNDTLQQADRDAIGQELSALNTEVNRIAQATQFNGKTLLSGSLVTTDAGTGTLGVQGALLATTKLSIQTLDVSNAAGATFTLAAANGSGTTVDVTLTNGTTGVSQKVNITQMTSAGNQTLNFSTLGISLTLTGGNALGTQANIVTDLNTKTIITTAGAAQLQIGANQGQTMSVSVSDMQASAIGNAGGYASLNAAASGLGTAGTLTTTVAGNLLLSVDKAIGDISTQRSKLGALQNRLEHTIANLDVSSENLTASESRIRDVDMASETVKFTRAQILKQAGTSVLAQANQAPQGVLALLR
jgi:flagellin